MTKVEAIQKSTNEDETSEHGWINMVQKHLPAEMVNFVGLTVGNVTVRANNGGAMLSIPGRPSSPFSDAESLSVSAQLGNCEVRTLHATLGAILSEWDEQEEAA